MPDNPELRIVITGEDSAGKQAPAPQSGVDPSKPSAQSGPSVPERAGLDAIVAANLAALREAIGRNDKTSKEAVETLKVLGAAKSALPGADQYRALLESVVKGRLNPPQPPTSQPAPKLPEPTRAARLPAPVAEASRRGIITLPRDQYTVDATQPGGALGPPRPPDWQPPRLPGPGQPPANLPRRGMAAAGGGMMLPPAPPGGLPPQLPPTPGPGNIPPAPAVGGMNLQNVTMFLGALYFGTRVLGEFMHAVQAATRSLDEMVKRYGNFAPQTLGATATTGAEGIIRDIQRAQRIDDTLSKYVRASFELEQQWEDFKATLLTKFGPTLIEALNVARELISEATMHDWTGNIGRGMNILNQAWQILPKALQGKGGFEDLKDAFQQWVKGDLAHKKALEDAAKKAQADEVAKDFAAALAGANWNFRLPGLNGVPMAGQVPAGNRPNAAAAPAGQGGGGFQGPPPPGAIAGRNVGGPGWVWDPVKKKFFPGALRADP
jgi:hypothetical protein